jgi:hypothetical protein
MTMKRREFLTASVALNIGVAASVLAQQGSTNPGRAGRGDADRTEGGGRGRVVPKRSAKTTRLFKSPDLYPNALAVMTDPPGGLWIGQQKATPQNAMTYGVPLDPNRDESAWLVDWNGKLLKTVNTRSRNTSGMAYGNGCVWMGANADPYGIFQVEMSSNQVSHRQIPLSIDGNGGGCHGVKWHKGKLWIAALRLGGILRVDPTTWTPEVLIRVSSDERPRLSRCRVRQRREHLGRHRQQQHELRRRQSRPQQIRWQNRPARDDDRIRTGIMRPARSRVAR